jgi:hypothetical protein
VRFDKEAKMRRVIAITAVVAGITFLGPVPAWATNSPTTGQPGAPTNTCGSDNPTTPGGSANVTGSPFNSNGQAGVVYAGNPLTASLQHANSTVAVSQYDVACVRLSH